MKQTDLIYEGKAKRVYKTDQPDKVLIEFKDDLTAFNAAKKGSFAGKGMVNARISQILFNKLRSQGVASHYCEMQSPGVWLCQKLNMIPLEVVVRNRIAGSLAKKMNQPEGGILEQPLVEFFLKNDSLNDPQISKKQIVDLGMAKSDNLDELEKTALKINRILGAVFAQANIDLVDFKIEFGLNPLGELVLADEISPDSCRLWDKSSGEKLDKDVFRRDLGDISLVYKNLLQRLETLL